MAAVVAVLLSMLPAQNPAAAQSSVQPDPDLFISHALSFRLALAYEPALQADELRLLPSTELNQSEELKAFWPGAWSQFMRGAVARIGMLRSPTPVAMYYNPLMDVAALTVWRATPRRYDLISFRFVPGERIRRSSAESGLLPAWRLADAPYEALREVWVARLAEFSEGYPGRSERVINPSPASRGHKVASQGAAEARVLAHLNEMLDAMGTPEFAVLERLIEAELAAAGSSEDAAGKGLLAARLADAPEAFRRLLFVRHFQLDPEAGRAIATLGFPHRPKLILLASVDLSDDVAQQPSITGVTTLAP